MAAIIGALVLLTAHWFDAGVLVDAQRQVSLTYDVGPMWDLIAVAHLLTAAGTLALIATAWWSRSLFVGIGYAVVGGFIAFLPILTATFAFSTNGGPTVAPHRIAVVLIQWFDTVEMGQTGAVFTLSAVMLFAGLAVVGFVALARWRGVGAATATPTPAAQSDPS